MAGSSSFGSTEGVDHAYEYVVCEGDTRELTDQKTPWIDPSALKLRHRIGRGPFGDVWLATHHHHSTDEVHEVAVKRLHPVVGQDHSRGVLDKFNDVFLKCQSLESVCKLQGVSVISGKICIITKFYEKGSVGDKMGRLKGGKFPLVDVLRYGIHLAQGIAELHSKGNLVLNLKPFNFLLNQNDHAILGDFGIPYLFVLGEEGALRHRHRLGTPNYMAPEQWHPEERGPISFEVDSWGFGCSILEMLTGIQPWRGKSSDEIYDLVVTQHEKPMFPPFDLPPELRNVLLGCFEYDFRSRPLMKHILNVFISLQSGAMCDDGAWVKNLVCKSNAEKSNITGYTEWFVLKDDLQVGDVVRSRKPSNSCKFLNMDIPEGTVVVGLEDSGSFALVRVHGIHDPLRVHVSSLERVTFGLAPGDSVRLKEEENITHSPVGILHSIDRSGRVSVGFIGMETLWTGSSSDLQMAESYCIGQFVRLKSKVMSPRFNWPHKRGGVWATGRISWICPNGCLVVKFPGMLAQPSSFLADAAEVEVITFNNCPGMVEKYQHLEDFHWAVRPILVGLGVLTAMKVGFCIGKRMQRSSWKAKQHVSGVEIEVQNMEGQSNSPRTATTWRNILFSGDA